MRRIKRIRVPVLDEEDQIISMNAKLAGVSKAAYLRALGLNETPKSTVDLQVAKDLLLANADLGRLGGLLKQALQNSNRLDPLLQSEIRGLMKEIRTGKSRLIGIAEKIVNFSG